MIKKRIILTGLFLLLFIDLGIAQRKVIVDASTLDPISYVAIYSKNNPKIGIYSGWDGAFVLPTSLPASDTLVFSLLGYQTYFVVAHQVVKSDTLYLHEEPLQLPDLTISPKKEKRIMMGPKSSKGNLRLGSRLSSWYSELAVLFKPPVNSPMYVNSLEIYLLNDEADAKDGFVRVNMYTVGDNQFPAEPLINRSFLIKVVPRRLFGKWYSVDLSNIQLQIPEPGLFVAVEFFPVSGSGLTSNKINIRFGKNYHLKTVERIAGNAWRNSMTQKIRPDYSPLIRLYLSN
jgi:hypothetical protein